MLVCSVMLKKFGRKTIFYNKLKCEWDMHNADNLCAWVDTCIGIFMDFMMFMNGMVYLRVIWKEEYY